MNSLERAVAAWIRADHLFRYGPRAYSSNCADWLCEAEDNLRLALTGEKDSHRAARVLSLEAPKQRLKLRKP